MPPNVIIPVQITAITSSGMLRVEMSRHPCVISTMPLKIPTKKFWSTPKSLEKMLAINSKIWIWFKSSMTTKNTDTNPPIRRIDKMLSVMLEARPPFPVPHR